MSPTLLLLRLLAVLLAPLLVVPDAVLLGPGAAGHRPKSARALTAAGQAAEVFDPLVPLPDRTAHGPPDTEDTLAAAAGDGPVAAAPAAGEGKQPAGKTARKAVTETPQNKDAPANGDKQAGDKVSDVKAKKKEEKGRAAAKEKAAPPANPRSLYLAVGHGRTPNGKWHPGAVHPGTGAHETDAAQIMADAMNEILRESPHVELHAEGGDHPNVRGSVAAANTLGVDDCIELHQDTTAAPPGVFAHWYTGAAAARRLADRLVGAVANHGVPVRHDWHRARPGLYWVRKTECRAVLIEVGRVGEFSATQLRAYGQSMAEAYLADVTGRD